MRLIRASEYAALPHPPKSWIIETLLSQGAFHVLAGEPFCGKSTLAIQMAFAVARGDPFFGLGVDPGAVLYYQFDASDLVWGERLNRLRDVGFNLDGEVHFLHPSDRPRRPNIMDPYQFRERRSEIEGVTPKLIIIDNYRKFHSGSEDKSETANIAITRLKELTDGYASLLIHHTKKPSDSGMDTPQNLIRGSTALSGEADGQIVMLEGTLHTRHRLSEDLTLQGYRREEGLWGFNHWGPPSP